MTRNQLDYWGKVEQARSNRAQESLKGREIAVREAEQLEQARFNRATEGSDSFTGASRFAGVQATMRGQDIASATADKDRSLRASQLAEDIRHNLVVERQGNQDVLTRQNEATTRRNSQEAQSERWSQQSYNEAMTRRDQFDMAALERSLRRDLAEMDINERYFRDIISAVFNAVNAAANTARAGASAIGG